MRQRNMINERSSESNYSTARSDIPQQTVTSGRLRSANARLRRVRLSFFLSKRTAVRGHLPKHSYQLITRQFATPRPCRAQPRRQAVARGTGALEMADEEEEVVEITADTPEEENDNTLDETQNEIVEANRQAELAIPKSFNWPSTGELHDMFSYKFRTSAAYEATMI